MSELGSVGLNAIRSTIGGALLIAWVLATAGAGAFTAISASAWLLLGLSIVTAIALGDTVFFESTRAIGVGRAMTISTTYPLGAAEIVDRKSTRLNSSHVAISYAVFCLKKKKKYKYNKPLD